MRNSIILMSTIELVCIAILFFIMSAKETLSKRVVDLGIVLIILVMVIALVWFTFKIIHTKGVGL